MKKLGYIVSKRKINNAEDYVGVVDDVSKVEDPTKPIIIIGLEEAKKVSPNFSILNKMLDIDVFWTFGKTERRVDYERDLDKFYDYVLNKSIENIKYYYINILTIKYNKIKKLLNIINSKEKKYIYTSNDMIYIYYNNNILGISLKILKYININIKKIYKILYSNKNNIIYNNDSFLTSKMRKVINNKKYVIPYFISILEEN